VEQIRSTVSVAAKRGHGLRQARGAVRARSAEPPAGVEAVQPDRVRNIGLAGRGNVGPDETPSLRLGGRSSYLRGPRRT
jgi:hypothetical protein